MDPAGKGDAEANGDLRSSAQQAVPFAAITGALQIVFSLLSMVLLVRHLEPNLYGVWAVLLGLGAPTYVLVSMGNVHMLYRFLPAVVDPEARRKLLWSVLVRRVALGVLVFGGLMAAFPLFAGRLGVDGHRALFVAMLPGFLCLTANQYVQAGLNVAFRQRDILVANVSNQSFFVVGVAIGIAREASLATFGWLYSAAAAVQLGLGLVALLRHVGAPRINDWREPVPESGDQGSYRRTSFVDDLGTMLLSQDVNRIVLAAFSTPAQVAVFAVASTIAERLRLLQPLEIFRPLATVAFFRRHEESGSIDTVNRMFRFLYAVNRVVTVLYLVLFVPLGAAVLVVVFRADYADAYWPTVVLFSLLAVFGMPIGIVAQALKRPRVLVYAKSAVLVNVGLGIPLAAAYGAMGMAIAAAAAGFFRNALAFGLIRREFAIRYPWSTLLRYGVAGLVVGGLVAILHPLIGVIGAGGVGGVAWLVALRVFGVLGSEDRDLLLSLAPERARETLRRIVGS